MDQLVDLFTGGLGGSIVGAVSGAVGKWYDGRMKVKMFEMNLERDKMLNEHELKMQSQEAAAAVKQMEYAALQSSMEMDKASYSLGSDSVLLRIVDFVRGLVRPILTATLTVYSLVLVIYVTKTYSVEFSESQVYELVYMMIENLTILTGLAIAWWFGSRDHSKNFQLGGVK